jgi:tripartite-type tricarboxylate transporter receptor subunit TctC
MAKSATKRTVLLGLAAGACLRPALAADYYEGKTIVIVCGYNPGGGVDLGTRLIAEHLGAFVPGSPRVVVQNMEGAGGLIAANHLYNQAPRDGLTLAAPGRDWMLKPLLGFKNARFDPLRFEYIGSSGANNDIAMVHRDTGVSNGETLRAAKRPVLFGGLPGVTINTAVPKVFEMLGWPVRVIGGYDNTARIVQAIEQREVDAIYTAGVTFGRRHDLTDAGIVRPVFQSVPLLPGVATAESLVEAKDRPLMALAHGQLSLGMPLVAPPGTPPERVAILRAAFMAMARDPDFVAHAERIDEPTGAPLSGEAIGAGARDIVAGITPEAVAAYSKF